MLRRSPVVAGILIVACFLASCGGRTPAEHTVEPIGRDETPTVVEGGEDDGDTIAFLRAAAPRERPASVYDKIHQAFLDGEIDRQTEVLLTLQAAYSPDALPEKYAAPEHPAGKQTLKGELQWLINHHHELDPRTEAIVRPFVLSAGDPGSYFHPAFDSGERPLRGLSLVKPAYAGEIHWSQRSVAVSGAPHPITLHYREQGLPATQQAAILAQVEVIEGALKKAWPMFTDLLAAHLGRELKIFLTDRLADNINGDAVYYANHYEVRLNEAQSGQDASQKAKSLQSTTAHELFHCFQFEIGLTWYVLSTDLDWLMEATAVWSEHYVYPQNDTEHQYLEEYFYCLDHDRLSTTGLQEYGSYTFFFFLSDVHGKKGYVADTLRAAAAVRPTMDIRGMLSQVIDDIKEVYGAFAVCNWNYPPKRCYPDKDAGFPSDWGSHTPSGTSIALHRVNTPEKTRHEDWLTPGGMIYRVFHFDASPEEIQKVTFDFKGEDSNSPGGFGNDMQWVKRQALIRIGDTWLAEPEDWTDLDSREFCRKQPAEKVTYVILILSNAGMAAVNNVHHVYVVDTEESCADLKGFVRMSMEVVTKQMGDVISETVEWYSQEELVYCPECEWYVLKKRTMTFQSLYYVSFLNPFLLAVGQEKRETLQTTGTGQLTEKYEPGRKFGRIAPHASGDKLTINFQPAAIARDWVTFVTSGTFPEVNTTEKGNPYGFDLNLTDFEVGGKTYGSGQTTATEECKIGDNVFYGIRTVVSGGASCTFEFRFEFVGASSDD